MNIQEYQKTYREYKAELDAELTKMSEGFVKVGYLLKVARDTRILSESGYDSVVEFAKAEYGIDKTQVSRFIRINDRFSENGYSDHLQTDYQGYGYAKLTLMLQLPDAVNEELTASYSKAEIQAIKEEVDAENEVTDIERMLEEPDTRVTDCLQEEGKQEAADKIEQKEIARVITQLGEEEPGLFVELHACMKELQDTGKCAEEMISIMAPQGEKTYSLRVPKLGRFMLMIKDTEDTVQLIHIRSGEKTTWTWEDVRESWIQLMDFEKSPEMRWTELYGQEFSKVAPVQPDKKLSKKESKVTRAKKERKESKGKTVCKEPEKVDFTSCDGDSGKKATEMAAGIQKEKAQNDMDILQSEGKKPARIAEEEIPVQCDCGTEQKTDLQAEENQETESMEGESEIVSGEVEEAHIDSLGLPLDNGEQTELLQADGANVLFCKLYDAVSSILF